jgi:dTDP-4-dehydrorhamnose 3,5-epimerase
MRTVSIDAVQVTSLKRIQTPGGDVLHALKASDSGFAGFGEAYFSWVESGAVKAWKCHQRMTLNLVVPLGVVRFVFYSPDHGKFRREEIGECRYVRLTVPPGVWFGFQGIGGGASLVMNLADIEHDPGEVLRKSVSEIDYDWNAL